MPRVCKLTSEEVIERDRARKAKNYQDNKEKYNKINRANYYKNINDDVKLERIKKILNTMENKELIKTIY